MRIQTLLPEQYSRWDEFVFAHPHGTPFHLTAWKETIQESLGYSSPYYLAAVEGEAIRAVLPMFLVRNWLIGKVLVSSPFAVYGGLLTDSAAAAKALREHVEELARSLGVDYVELRNSYPQQCTGLERLSRYVTFRQRLGISEDAILKSIPRKTRAMVRKALGHPFSTRREFRDPSRFEDLYSRNLKRLGTPAFPSVHFAALLRHFAGMIDIREVLYGDKVVAAALTFYFRDQVLPYYGASDPAYNEYAPNNYMYFDLMREAAASGYRWYDFGRSRAASGSFAFKAHWGMEMQELPYEMLLVRKKEMPHYSPSNPRFSAAMKVWQNLPLAMTRALGPSLIRLFP